jgi:hypothetical protein
VGGNAPRTEGSLLFLYVLLMQSRCGIIAAMQRLVFRGQTMTDSDVLAGLGLHGESVLHVVRRAVGGGHCRTGFVVCQCEEYCRRNCRCHAAHCRLIWLTCTRMKIYVQTAGIATLRVHNSTFECCVTAASEWVDNVD